MLNITPHSVKIITNEYIHLEAVRMHVYETTLPMQIK